MTTMAMMMVLMAHSHDGNNATCAGDIGEVAAGEVTKRVFENMKERRMALVDKK